MGDKTLRMLGAKNKIQWDLTNRLFKNDWPIENFLSFQVLYTTWKVDVAPLPLVLVYYGLTFWELFAILLSLYFHYSVFTPENEEPPKTGCFVLEKDVFSDLQPEACSGELHSC